jgi:hypothetical protein
VIWEVDSESIKFNVTLGSPIIQIDWSSPANPDRLLLLLNNGEIKMLDLTTKAILNIDLIGN